MNIAELFIKRPVMTTLVMVGILLFGIMGYRLLPVSDLPNVDFPTIQVSASLPGANPETMASAIATPLEKQFTTIAGLDNMNSTSSQGTTQITLQFNLSRNLDGAAQDVQAMIAAAAGQLPPEMPTPPSYQKVNPADSPIVYLALTSATLPLSQLDEYGETFMAQRISTIPGVAQVLVYGPQKYAVRIQLDPNALATRGIGIDEVADAVRNANVNLPTGTLYGPSSAFTVQATGQLNDAAAYRPILVSYKNGAPVRLDQVGRVIDSVEADKSAAWFNGDRSISLAIQRQPGTNTVEVAGAIRRLLPTFEKELPPAAKLHVLFDRSVSIRASVGDVKFTLFLTLCLVVLVIFVFLRNVSATVIPSLALPLSIAGTFAFMYLLGYSMDNLSLMALTLSVGFVVDDAIVMLENIVRHMEMGETVMQASLSGSKEIGFTILSMTISLAAVFIPVLFMGGIVGRLFHEFAVTIGVAILLSGFISLSLTPMLCSRFLRPHEKEEKHGRVYQASERAFDAMLGFYERTLKSVLRHGPATLVFSLVILAATVFLFVKIPKGFLPSEDMGQVFGFTEAAQGISFPAMKAHQVAVADVIRRDPNIENLLSSCGPRGHISNGNQGIVFAKLQDRGKRKLSVDEIIQELRPKLARIPGISVYLQNPPPIRIGGSLSKSQYQYTLQDPDTNELYRYAPELEAKMREIAGLQDVTSDMQLKNPQINIRIDRDKAGALGITPQKIEDALYTAYG
ncbi:MAG: efflux RND transporter permease subunit, partial [Thermoanaerobaculia bacterium]